MVEFWKKFLYMDKRIIYVLMAVAVTLPMFVTFGLPVTVHKPAQDFYDRIEELPEGAIVWVGAEISPSQLAEFQPMIRSIFRHCFEKKLRIVVQGFSTQGCTLALTWAEPIIQEFNAVYGEDYVSIGYRTGMSATMDNARRDIIDAYSDRDAGGDKLSTMPIMAGLTKASDIDLNIVFTSGSPGVAEYISYWQATGDVMNMIACAAAVQIPTETVRYNAGMLKGICGGMSGAAQYEKLVGVLGTATSGMDSQGLGHLVIILLVILGNIGHFIVKNADRKARA